MSYFPLVQRFESALWVSLVSHGQNHQFFRDSLDWDFGVTNYRYREHRHQIYIPDSQQLGELIGQMAEETRYPEYRARCEAACATVLRAAAYVRDHFDPSAGKAAQYDLFEHLLTASLRAMPFLPSLVLIQNELQQDLRSALAYDLGVPAESPEIEEFWQRALVPKEQANFVPESRSVLRMARDYRADELPLDAAVAQLPRAWIDRLDAHVKEYGWLGTFTYLNEPYAPENILRRVQSAAESEHDELQETLDRDRAAVQVAEMEYDRLTTDRARTLLDAARQFMYLRFERVDVHFKAEVMTRPIQHRLAQLAGITRDELVMLTLDELRSWAREDGDLPSRNELARRTTNGIDYEVADGLHFWRTADPIVREIDPVARKRAQDGLPGVTACLGRAEGPVKHVTSVADMQSFDEGDILVTPMTTPDVMYAIERAAGIVTDEGGILCHAAIISRELNKPCVIGCEVATHAFRNGDVVQLTADTDGGAVTLLTNHA